MKIGIKRVIRIGVCSLLSILGSLDMLVAQSVCPQSEKESVWSLRTNALYDVFLIPNIGVAYSWDDRWSAHLHWMYGWWKNDSRHRYWRTYCGELEVRYWLGTRSDAQQVRGHHVGLYGQMLTYDFEWGGRGYLGDKWSYAGGVSYGYAWRLAERWRLDCSMGVGYFSGLYKEYVPIDTHYVWQSTKRRRWLGPTWAELSFVYLLGRKGGKR